MKDKFNKGFKGIDRQANNPSLTDSLETRGLQHVKDRFLDRKNYKKPSPQATPENPFEIRDWRVIGWRVVQHETSGSILYGAEDTAYKSSWYSKPGMSVPTLKVWNWDGTHSTSSVSFRRGINCGGNVSPNNHGFWGMVPRSLIGRNNGTYGGGADGGTGIPYSHIYQNCQRAWNYYAAADSVALFDGTGTSPVYTQTSTSPGDKFTIQWTEDGVVSYLYNDSTVYTSTIHTTGSWGGLNDFEYHQTLSQNTYGNDQLLYPHSYNWEFIGDVNPNPYWFDNQLNQELENIPLSSWQSSSAFYKPFEQYDGNFGMRTVHNASGNYNTYIWSEYYITGSGIGGIFRFDFPIHLSNLPYELIVGPSNYDKISGHYYNDANAAIRPNFLTWNETSDPSGSGYGCMFNLPSWYAGEQSQRDLAGASNIPIATGSKFALIITGSDWGFLSETGSGLNLPPNPDNGQICAILFKAVTGEGYPVNDYISNHWHLYGYGSFIGTDGGAIKASNMLIGDGVSSDQIENIKIGSNYIISGSI
jgi:hypothetical protein